MRNVNKRFNYNYNQYPSCCVAGLATDFSVHGKGLDMKEKEAVWADLDKVMAMSGHSIALLMDIEHGMGFTTFQNSPKVQFLSSTFNKNSGNAVYLMQYTL